MSEENILDVISCMEFDPLLPPGSSYRRHRDFLLKAQFREPIPITKPEILSKIHLNYRMTYIKDVILLRYLDDPTMSSINSIIFFNNVALITGLTGDEPWMKAFFAEMHKLAGWSPRQNNSYMSTLKRKANDEADELEVLEKAFQRKNLFLFLQELCMLGKSLQANLREDFYASLNEYGMFRAIEDALSASCPSAQDELWLWLAVADVLTNSLNHDPNLLRNYIHSRLTVPTSLLGCLIDAVVAPSVDSGLADQLAQIVRMVLDPESMSKYADKDAFLDNFYTKHMPKLASAVLLLIFRGCT